MKKSTLIPLLAICAMLSGCARSPIENVWTNDHVRYKDYSKLLVAALTTKEDTALNEQIEKRFVLTLGSAGLNAVSAIDQFRSAGLANLEQEETYLKLCYAGIDAVIIIALTDNTVTSPFRLHDSHGYTASYYYNRIWNYKNTIPLSVKQGGIGIAGCHWEIILFDLLTLEPQCFIRYAGTSAPVVGNNVDEFSANILQMMVRKKILVRP